jgi:hypothetical protein
MFAGIEPLRKGETYLSLTDIPVKGLKPSEKPQSTRTERRVCTCTPSVRHEIIELKLQVPRKNLTLTFRTYNLVRPKQD